MNRIIYTVILASFALASMAQAGTKIDASDFDHKLFERLLFNKVNEFRVENGRKALVKNIYLYKVANDHNLYLKNKKKLTHQQDIPGKINVQDRLKAYIDVQGYSVGENLARTFVLKPTHNYMRDGKTSVTTATTYEEAAEYMLNAWIQSTVHKDNMLDPGFELAAIASYYNPMNGSLTGVQVFATIK